MDALPNDGNNGGQETLWFDGLAPELKSNPNVTRYKSIEELVRGKIQLDSFVGADENNILKLPKEGDQEGWKNVYKRLGAPEKADDYAWQFKEGFPGLPDDMQGQIRAKFHELGLGKNQAAEIMNLYQDFEMAAAKQIEDQRAADTIAAELALKSHWGKAYDDTMVMVQEWVKSNLPQNDFETLAQSGLATNPLFNRIVGDLVRKTGERVALPGAQQTAGLTPERRMSRNEVRQAIEAKEKDPNFRAALSNKQHPNHGLVLKEWKNLLELEANAT